MDILGSPNWYSKRAELYKDVSAWVNKPFDEVFFELSAPECGWIRVTVFVNGKKKHRFPLTAAFDSMPEIKTWLEDVVNDTKLSTDLYLDLEARVAILHYEHIRLADIGCQRKFVKADRGEDEWEWFDVNSEPDTGLFYLYDSGCEDIPVVCYCKTKEFIFALYNSLMYYASMGKYAHLIGKEWFYIDHDEDGNPTESRWTFYNRMKSPIIEWNQDSKRAFRHEKPKFKETPFVVETIHMRADCGEGLFWDERGACCGNADGLFVATDNSKVVLSDMPEVRKWYDEFVTRDTDKVWTDEDFAHWFNRGWELAKKIRERLPLNVDLFYHWKTFIVDDSESGGFDIPYLVPDNRLLIVRKENS